MPDAIYDSIVHVFIRELNTSNDPRVGSARDNSTSTSALRATSGGSNSASFSTLFMTFLPVAIYAAVCVIIFVVLRPKLKRVYAPRTFLSSLGPHERTEILPNGYFKWVKKFWQTPDAEVLNRSSLEGFLFLRYLKVLCTISCFGAVLTWPILIPLHFYGGNGDEQLDQLTFGNIDHVNWLYVHAFVAWIFYGYILYTVTRECVYFINLRQAYLLSPYYASRISSRTVLFTCVPSQILDERKLRRVFGDTVKNVWIPRESDELEELVKEREQTANRLEEAEILLIKKANEAYRKALKNGHPDIVATSKSLSTRDSKDMDASVFSESPASPGLSIQKPNGVDITVVSQTSSLGQESKKDSEEFEITFSNPASPRAFLRADGTPFMKTNYGYDGPPPDINGSVAAQWIPAQNRPRHRPIANYGRRVDTIKWTRNRLKQMGPKISKLRREYKKGRGRPMPVAFIEFQSQVDAQSAYQTLAHHSANHMRPEIVGVRPQEIIWSSLNFRWWERIIRRFLIQGFVAVMVIFWSLPAALVGIVSNINFLTTEVFFLKWIAKLPSPILGLISGLLPAVALSLLMSAVPIMLRVCARQAGIPTVSRVELFVQNAYFVFQVVQVFLVTTITSAASAALKQLISNPLSARVVLSQNLPKASNFYISYFILQGLAMSATRLVHLGSIFRHHVMRNGSTPRLMAKKWHRLRMIHWGSVYPVFTNLGVIAITYSLIAPIVLGVATLGLGCVYIVYRYNLLYIYSSERDTRGLHYPRALKQTLTGVYLSEICLIGLFTIKGAYGPMVLIFGLLIFTALIHTSLSDALSPLLFNLPRTLAAEEELRKLGNPPFLAANLEDKNDGDVVIDAEEGDAAGYDSDFDPSDPTTIDVDHGPQVSRGPSIPVEGSSAAVSLTTRTVTSYIRKKYEASGVPAFINFIDFWSYWITPEYTPKPNFVLRWLHPEIFESYHVLREMMDDKLRTMEIQYEEGVVRDAFATPSVRMKSPRLWIPRDWVPEFTQEPKTQDEEDEIEAAAENTEGNPTAGKGDSESPKPPSYNEYHGAGVSKQEVMHTSCVCEITDEGAWLDEKGNTSVDLDGEVVAWIGRGLWDVKF